MAVQQSCRPENQKGYCKDIPSSGSGTGFVDDSHNTDTKFVLPLCENVEQDQSDHSQ